MVANRKAYRTTSLDVGQKGEFWSQISGQRLYDRFHHNYSFYQTGMKKQFVWTTSLGCIALLAAETIFFSNLPSFPHRVICIAQPAAAHFV